MSFITVMNYVKALSILYKAIQKLFYEKYCKNSFAL